MGESVQSYSTNEIARRLGVSPQTVQRWVDTGRLSAWKTPGGHRRIDAKSAELMFEEHERTIGHKASPVDSSAPQARVMEVVIVDDDRSIANCSRRSC